MVDVDISVNYAAYQASSNTKYIQNIDDMTLKLQPLAEAGMAMQVTTA